MKRSVKKKPVLFLIFLSVFIALFVFTTIQSFILSRVIDFDSVSKGYIWIILCYWIVVSIAFTILTSYQINKNFGKPMMRFVEATEAVANGDFSVYIPPIHTSEKQDYFDVMFLNFNKMVEALGSIETLKTEFFSNVSHEIKTPLSVILNYAEVLKKGDLTQDQIEEYIEIIIQSSKRLSELITNILKLNKLEKQVIEPLNEPFDLCEQLCQCALQFENMWEHKNIEFEADIEDKAMIEADSSLLELVWNNLLSNAFKFTEPGGTVTLHQTSSENEIIVSVKDTGCGMGKETIKLIFDKFYQGDTSHSMEGNGLGLTLASRIIQLLDGRITVDSELDVGTIFAVYIPVRINEKFTEGSSYYE